jgi:hypothetical protein
MGGMMMKKIYERPVLARGEKLQRIAAYTCPSGELCK